MTDEQKTMLDECLDKDEGLTAWDMEFIESMDLHYRSRDLSTAQATQLERIANL